MIIKNLFIIFILFLFSVFTYGIFLANHEFKILDNAVAIDESNEFYDYKGLLHVQYDKKGDPLKYKKLIENAKEQSVHFIPRLQEC